MPDPDIEPRFVDRSRVLQVLTRPEWRDEVAEALQRARVDVDYPEVPEHARFGIYPGLRAVPGAPADHGVTVTAESDAQADALRTTLTEYGFRVL